VTRDDKMRKIIVLTFITLDGVMQAPGGPEEDPTGGFKYGGWTAGYWDDILGNVMAEQMAGPFDLLLGRKTYEIFAAYWPYVKSDNPDYGIAAKFNSAQKYVASRALKKLDWNNSELIKADVAQEIKKLKQQSGPELQVHGSGNLVQTLLKHDLVDEFRLKIFPITLGTGKRLFSDGTIPAGLNLVDSGTSTTGVIVATYERAGDVKTWSFAGSSASETPSEAELARRQRLKEGR
jgi:dihydrofolate reductase